MKKPTPPRLPEPPAQVAARKTKQRKANRDFAKTKGWNSDPEAFFTAWRTDKIKVTFEYSEAKG